MRNLLRTILTSILGALARSIIRKYKPTVVMVTGSVGKTSTKDAVAAALGENFYVRKSEKSFNSGFGVPLTIIGAKNPWTNPGKWFGVVGSALGVIFLPNHYPKLLVLEVGADAPGDLAKIMKIVRPSAVVVTLLPSVPVHVEAYETPAAVREEEFVPALALPPNAPLIYNADDEYTAAYAQAGTAELYTFGTAGHAKVQIMNPQLWIDKGEVLPKGMQATLLVHGEEQEHQLRVAGALGHSQLLAPAAAIVTAIALGLKTKEAMRGLEKSYLPPPGRGRLFAGKKGTVLIDDTYNSSPAAVEEILRSLSLLKTKGRKIAVLGDMLELGRYSVAEHIRIGHIVAETCDVLVTVGNRSLATAAAAQEDGMDTQCIFSYTDSLEVVEPLEAMLEEGDVLLVKGSQSIRMERIVRPLLADFADVQHLVRQENEWLKR